MRLNMICDPSGDHAGSSRYWQGATHSTSCASPAPSAPITQSPALASERSPEPTKVSREPSGDQSGLSSAPVVTSSRAWSPVPSGRTSRIRKSLSWYASHGSPGRGAVVVAAVAVALAVPFDDE
jgi:hypothetical protein